MIESRLREWAVGRGYGLAIAGTGLIFTVRDKLDKRRERGLIEADFFEANLRGFRYLEDTRIKGPAVLVVVAVPKPIHVLPLVKDGKRLAGLIPPTYVRYRATFNDVLADMKANALGEDVQAEVLKAPLKSLAVHMGLVAYGRNNITYAAGLGSGLQLCGYIVGLEEKTAGPGAAGGSDAGPGGADRGEKMLDRCVDCRACLKVCPTGAIREDRFLISAERCFTFLSESRDPMPAWARAPRTLCLIGCLACQEICPENKGRLGTEPSGIEFSEEETEALLEAGRRLGRSRSEAVAGGKEAAVGGPLASALEKFGTLGMTEDFEVMGRNLALFLK